MFILKSIVFFQIILFIKIVPVHAQENQCPQEIKSTVYNTKLKGGLTSGVMSYEKAVGFFNEVQKSKYGIPFKYVEDGCDMRALLISKTLKEKYNVMTFRVALEATPQNLIRTTPYTAEGIVEFNRHTAAAICVLNPKTEKIEPYVIDPSFFKTPVPLSDWKNGFNDKGKVVTKLYYGNMYSLDPKSRRTSFSKAELAETERLRKAFAAAEAKMLKTGVKPYGVGRARGYFEGDNDLGVE
jgi:hypothetical protein